MAVGDMSPSRPARLRALILSHPAYVKSIGDLILVTPVFGFNPLTIRFGTTPVAYGRCTIHAGDIALVADGVCPDAQRDAH